jgi:hypothetical protein
MRFDKFTFGSIRIDGVTHEHDVVIESTLPFRPGLFQNGLVQHFP